MVIIPAGTFCIGSPAGEDGRFESEGPTHSVRFARPFAVGKYPVTVAEFRQFVAAAGHDTGASATILTADGWRDCEGRGWRDPGFPQTDLHPVTCVNWRDARAYVAWLNTQVGVSAGGGPTGGYRLLTEAEWEYACRAGALTPFAHGAAITPSDANFAHASGGTTAVGAYPANAFGLCDMHGGVAEWCEDCWAATYTGTPLDGSALEEPNCEARVLRGGSWASPATALRSASRDFEWSERRSSEYGFRVAKTLHMPVCDHADQALHPQKR